MKSNSKSDSKSTSVMPIIESSEDVQTGLLMILNIMETPVKGIDTAKAISILTKACMSANTDALNVAIDVNEINYANEQYSRT